MSNSAAALETNLAIPYIMKHRAIFYPVIPLLDLRNENLCPHKTLYVNVYISISPNSQNVEATQICINGWINKMWHTRIM